MGGDLLRGKILNYSEKYLTRRHGGTKFFFIFLLLILNTQFTQAEEERPLRSVRPSARSTVTVPSLPHAPYSTLPANSLITPEALLQPLTQHYIGQYSSVNGVAFLNSTLERALIFLPFIQEEVARRGLPPELVYLPIIESSFIVTARSRSGAVGLWQFMLNSISPFDIRVNDLIDERRDFIKSTRGALQKLEDNYRTLGSWELALAAYNAGLGAVNRTAVRERTRDYWELSARNQLRQETAHYVPKLIAASYILSQPRRFGINVWHTPFEWETVTLPRQVSLDLLAEAAGMEKDILRRLNAQLLHGITPADRNFRLIVPKESATRINEALEREDLTLIRYHYHVVRQGDTLWSMSRHYGTSQNIIEQHNPGISNRYLRLGETVVIPAFTDVEPPVRPSVSHLFTGSHVIQSGDTLWSLSRRFGVDPMDLAEANNMQLDQILQIGRTLKVPILE
jgi:membrane-bound lytic murein transglycosylase D